MGVRAAAAMLAVGLLVAGCGSERGSAGPVGADATTTATAPPQAAQVPSTAVSTTASRSPALPAVLNFTVKTLAGKPFHGSTLAGKPVVFWFWAPWCPKCNIEAGAVKTVADRYKTKVAFVGVAGLDTEAAMKDFVDRTDTDTFVQLSDAAGTVWTRLKVAQQSTFVFMKPDGSTTTASGPIGIHPLTAQVEKLLAG
jgi:thiol-disulfide isomerase/thioredoxin